MPLPRSNASLAPTRPASTWRALPEGFEYISTTLNPKPASGKGSCKKKPIRIHTGEVSVPCLMALGLQGLYGFLCSQVVNSEFIYAPFGPRPDLQGLDDASRRRNMGFGTEL